jgi:hypothetical protein
MPRGRSRIRPVVLTRFPKAIELMAYTDFSLETISAILGVSVETADVFPALAPCPVPQWLREMLDRGTRQVLLSDKARSEFIVVPVLLACQELSREPISIYSGQRLDVDPGRGLIGECDFILAATDPLPALRSPLMIIVEAKKNDVESGVWQCIAQMVGARIFNERSGRAPAPVYGCVTNGEAWQFLRLVDQVAEIDVRRYYIDNVGGILSVFRWILGHGGAEPSIEPPSPGPTVEVAIPV